MGTPKPHHVDVGDEDREAELFLFPTQSEFSRCLIELTCRFRRWPGSRLDTGICGQVTDGNCVLSGRNR